ncbi:hypothetical protein D043_0482B, partial [Vibrio parahaemolyticus EKP-021]
LIIDIYKT